MPPQNEYSLTDIWKTSAAPQSRPSPWDWGFAIFVSVVSVLEFTLRSDVTWPTLAVLLVVAPALVIRKTAPLAALIVGFLASTCADVYQLVTGVELEDLFTMAFMLLLPYGLVRYGSRRQLLGGAAVVSSSFVIGWIADSLSAQEAFGAVAVLTVSFVSGAVFRLREHNRLQSIEQAKSTERESIARDLHDTVAHHVSGIAVRAQAGLAVAESDPNAAVEALRVISIEASKTLDEMRSMVGTLRGEASALLHSHDGFAALESLARSGESPRIEVTVEGDTDGVAQSVSGAIFRITQEAMTNARRHAQGASQIVIAVEIGAEAVRLEVTNDGSVVSRPSGHVGYGLVGMTERAQLLGGHLEAGPLPSGGWRVTAELPRRGPPA